MNKSFFALLALTLSLVACKPQAVAPKERVAKPADTEHTMDIDDMEEWTEEEMAMMDEMDHGTSEVLAEQGIYTEYHEGIIGNGQKSVLFFHATWCPKCKENDGRLKEFYGSSDYPRSVYKVDYDTSSDLKSQYGVTGQDTFILIDENGREIERVRFPSRSALRDLLG